MRVGTIVKITRASAINKAGEIGVCYENYGTGASLIFQSGGYDGFSQEDMEIFGVEVLGFCSELEGYHFLNVMRLSDDFRKGVFNRAFILGSPLSTASVIHRAPNQAMRGFHFAREE